LELTALKNLIRVDLEQAGIEHISIANHYQIFDDLFMPGVYFHNVQQMDINFSASDSGVLFGNVINTANAQQQPQVSIGKIEGTSPSYSTLIMLNIDGDGYVKSGETETPEDEPKKTSNPYILNKNKAEMRKDEETENPELRTQLAQWLVANIPSDGVLKDGEVVIPYLQPVPFYGSGYHRIAFILLKHRMPLDMTQYFLNDGDELTGRKFNMNRFFKSFENEVTPSSLKFCQMVWDESCDETLKRFGLKSPRYWYAWNQPLKVEQKEFPMKSMPFNHYLDMFRTPESVRRQIRDLRLEMMVAQGGGADEFPQKPKYPDIFYAVNKKRLPYWLHMDVIKRNTGQGIYAALYSSYVNPATQHLDNQQLAEQSDEMEGSVGN